MNVGSPGVQRWWARFKRCLCAARVNASLWVHFGRSLRVFLLPLLCSSSMLIWSRGHDDRPAASVKELVNTFSCACSDLSQGDSLGSQPSQRFAVSSQCLQYLHSICSIFTVLRQMTRHSTRPTISTLWPCHVFFFLCLCLSFTLPVHALTLLK